VAGVGNGLVSTAPTFDPTCESLGVRFPRATRLLSFHSLEKSKDCQYTCCTLNMSTKSEDVGKN
jgi:hypothetical protein